MRLTDTQIEPAALVRGGVRVNARFSFERRKESLSYWFEFPESCAPTLSRAADPWAVLGLPLALYFQEPLRLERPLDPVLRANLEQLQAIWCRWYKELRPVEIDAPAAAERTPAGLVVSCMSGGVDSLHTYLRHTSTPVEGSGSAPVDAFLSVGGFNVPNELLGKWMPFAQTISDTLGRPSLLVATNLRFGVQELQTPFSINRWSDDLTHGASLAAIAHLAGNVRELIVPASRHASMLAPWGSHPETDPLLSSSALRIVHDGAEKTRMERIARIVEDEAAMRVLQVCFNRPAGGNCGRCEKCQRTMLLIDLLGARARAVSFDWSGYTPAALRRIWIKDKTGDAFYAGMADEARRLGREDLAGYIDASRSFARAKRAVVGFLHKTPVVNTVWRALRGHR